MKIIAIIVAGFVLDFRAISGLPPEFTSIFGIESSKSSLSQIQLTAAQVPSGIPFKVEYRKNKLKLKTHKGISSVKKSG